MKKALVLVVLWLLAGCAGAIATSATPPANLPPAGTAPANQLSTATPNAPKSMQVTWAGHGLTGRLMLILYHETGDTLIELDLQSGEINPIFQAPNKSKLLAASLSPDGKQFVLAYAAPVPGQIQLGNTDLCLLPLGSKDPPTVLLKRKDIDESFFGPAWAPDGKTIVYAHFYKTLIDNVAVYKYAIESTDLNGNTQTLIPDAFWPSISPDGTKIAYVYADPKGFTNDLYIADASGTNQAALTTPGVTPPVDAHFFSQDGQTIFFSMVNPQTQPASAWWETLFGIRTVSAHNVPSDWYRVPAAGGKIERVTDVNDTGLFGAASPDGSRLAFISLSGLFAVKPDGLDLIQLTDRAIEGNIQWLP